MRRNSKITITNYEGNDVILEWKIVAESSIKGSAVFSDLQTRIREALENPGFVFQQHTKRIYVRPFGKGVFAVYSDKVGDLEIVKELEFINALLREKWGSYNVIYQGT